MGLHTAPRHRVRLVFSAIDAPTIFNYYSDERDRDRSRRVGIFVGAGTSAELGFIPSGGSAIPEWIVVEWLYPISEGGRSREENTANATRYVRRFVLKEVLPEAVVDELRQTPNRLLEVSFIFRMSEAAMNWRACREQLRERPTELAGDSTNEDKDNVVEATDCALVLP